jgi:hypothetical protein
MSPAFRDEELRGDLRQLHCAYYLAYQMMTGTRAAPDAAKPGAVP